MGYQIQLCVFMLSIKILYSFDNYCCYILILYVLVKRWVPVDIPITTLKPEAAGKRDRNGGSGNLEGAAVESRGMIFLVICFNIKMLHI